MSSFERSGHPTMAATLAPQTASMRLAWQVGLIVIGCIAMTISAKIQVPFWPVPMTMQTFAAVMIGAVYGWRLGGATVAIYLAQGALGLPVFAAGGGIAYLLGPTGGYLIGFLAAAIVAGALAERGLGRSFPSALVLFAIANTVTFVCGLAWLSGIIGLQAAIAGGLMPFLPGEALKLALAAALLPLAWKAVARPD